MAREGLEAALVEFCALVSITEDYKYSIKIIRIEPKHFIIKMGHD